MNRVLTLREKAILNNGFFGVVWIIIGFAQIFEPNTIINIISIIFLLVGVVSILVTYFIKAEQDDEMSKYNKNRAKSEVYDILILIIAVFTLIVTFKGVWIIDLKMIMPFLLGGSNLIQFILFVFYEKVGA